LQEMLQAMLSKKLADDAEASKKLFVGRAMLQTMLKLKNRYQLPSIRAGYAKLAILSP
jgi:hypothetical protein